LLSIFNLHAFLSDRGSVQKWSLVVQIKAAGELEPPAQQRCVEDCNFPATPISDKKAVSGVLPDAGCV